MIYSGMHEDTRERLRKEVIFDMVKRRWGYLKSGLEEMSDDQYTKKCLKEKWSRSGQAKREMVFYMDQLTISNSAYRSYCTPWCFLAMIECI